MIVLGLTGSIGMGKSETVRAFRRLGVPVHDADAAVHLLLARGGAAVARVSAAFPGVVAAGAVDRRALGREVFADARALRRLEAILHPLVRRQEAGFLAAAARARRRLVVLDVPLLFETGGERRCDATITVSAAPWLQERRVLRRAGMTRARLAAIRAQQMPDREKCRRADFVVRSGLARRLILRQVRRILMRIGTAERLGRRAFPRRRHA